MRDDSLARDKERIQLHVRQWEHNRALITCIPASHPDWIVTVIFYTAVHAIDAALVNEGISVSNHETRFEAIGKCNRLKKAYTLYHPLYDLSRKTRYIAQPDLWIPPEAIEKQVLRRYLLPLEKSVIGLIGQTMNLPDIDLSHLQKSASTA
jgi:hypothetical protein